MWQRWRCRVVAALEEVISGVNIVCTVGRVADRGCYAAIYCCCYCASSNVPECRLKRRFCKKLEAFMKRRCFTASFRHLRPTHRNPTNCPEPTGQPTHNHRHIFTQASSSHCTKQNTNRTWCSGGTSGRRTQQQQSNSSIIISSSTAVAAA